MSSRPDPPDRPAQTPPQEVTSFGRLQVAWDERVLEPRSWTAAQSAWAVELLSGAPEGAVLELFAGAGHIGQLAVLDTPRRLVCVDLEPIACGYARLNARRNGLADRVEVRCAPIATAVDAGESYALVIADPPWVRSAEIERFPEDPRGAIDGGPDGLALARECLSVAAACLRPGGSLVLQVGTTDQAAALREDAGDRGLETRQVRTFDRGVLVHLGTTPAPDSAGRQS